MTNFPTDEKSFHHDPYHPSSALNFHNTTGCESKENPYEMTTISQSLHPNRSVPPTQETQAKLAKSKQEAIVIYKELKKLIKKEKKKAKKH